MVKLSTLSRRGGYAAVQVNRNRAEQTPRRFMGADEAANYLGICRKTLLKLAKSGVIPCQRTGRKYLFSVELVERWGKGELPNQMSKAGGSDYDGR